MIQHGCAWARSACSPSSTSWSHTTDVEPASLRERGRPDRRSAEGGDRAPQRGDGGDDRGAPWRGPGAARTGRDDHQRRGDLGEVGDDAAEGGAMTLNTRVLIWLFANALFWTALWQLVEAIAQ